MRDGPVTLRALDETDVERTHLWHNDRDLYATLGGPFRLVSRARATQWIRERLGDPRAVCAAICLTESTEHVGNIYVRDIDPVARHGEIHLFIAAPGHRGHGIGQAAIRAMTRHCFEDLGLERLHLKVLADNTAAIHAYRRCGFVEEGRLRNHALKGGAFRDVLVMGLCRADPPG